MDTCQWEFRSAVIERGGLPGSGRMACRAVLAEVACNVIGIRRTREVSAVALIAIGEHQLIVVIYMTRVARRGHVSAGERKLRGTMVKRRRLPRSGRVTRLAVLTEIIGDVVRVRCTVEVSAVTLIAIGEYQLVIPVRVARLARRGRVCAG